MKLVNRARNNTHRRPARYECRVVRRVTQDQPELATPLRLLKETTSNYVDYREIGKLGVTVVMLEPVLRQILGRNRRGEISREAARDFEAELRERLDHAQYAEYDIPLDPVNPLALYGKDKNWLGFQFSSSDYRLVGDRAVVETYIRDNYDKPDGDPVSQRFIDRNTRRLRPHVTIGEVRYENMEPEQVESFQADPATFLIQAAYGRMESNREEFGEAYGVTPIVLPQMISLNGLAVFCQQKQ